MDPYLCSLLMSADLGTQICVKQPISVLDQPIFAMSNSQLCCVEAIRKNNITAKTNFNTNTY